MIDLSFYRNRKVLVTGHTGFKGSWLCMLLKHLGADIYGYSLTAEDKSLYNLCNIDSFMTSEINDIRDYEKLKNYINTIRPEIIIHLAAQSTVYESYRNTRNTYNVNIMGTVNLLDIINKSDYRCSILNITTDKVYQNDNKIYSEDDIINGYDPYSNSKSCADLIAQTYDRTLFDNDKVLSILRTGNVIGGGDFKQSRLLSDCMNAFIEDKKLIIRNPYSTRPYQHVLDVLVLYLIIAMKQYEDNRYKGIYNIGPDKSLSNIEIVDMFNECLIEHGYNSIDYIIENNKRYTESDILSIDNSKIKKVFDYNPSIDIKNAIDEIISFSIAYKNNLNIENYIDNYISDYLANIL